MPENIKVKITAAPRSAESVMHTLITMVPFFAVLAVLVLLDHWLAYVVLVPLGSLFLLRSFILQHDCGHQALFNNRKANNILGSFIGIFTFTPYYYWKREHFLHHASSGNLDKRGHGDIQTLTVEEYEKLSKWGKFGYRCYRNPLIMLGLGPVYYFFIKVRFPFIIPRGRKLEKWSIVWTDLGIAALLLLLGLLDVRLIFLYLVIDALAAAMGILLFYVQHQFEDAYWVNSRQWDYSSAAIRGSSFLKLPAFLDWITGYISHHHLHHLNPKIPFYKLKSIMAANGRLQEPVTIKLRDMLKLFRLKLWDEKLEKMIPFSGLRSKG
jgi:omega-6 fatty acid desaturase (delta-12 desaturase)